MIIFSVLNVERNCQETCHSNAVLTCAVYLKAGLITTAVHHCLQLRIIPSNKKLSHNRNYTIVLPLLLL